MPTITTSDGVRLNYVDDGDPAGAPVVLVAGFRAPATSWRLQQGALATAGLRVLTFDRRSHGDSEDPAHGHTMARHGADLGEFLAALQLHDAVLVGGSMGASTIWSYVKGAGTDRMRAAVSVDQTPKMLNTDDWAYGFYGYTETNRDTYFAQGIPKTGHSPKRSARTSLRMMSALSRSPMDLVRANQFSPTQLALLHDHAVTDWRDVVIGFDVPMLMVAARESDYWPYEHATSCAERGKNVRAAVIDHCGHAANIEQPDEFNRILLDFIRSL